MKGHLMSQEVGGIPTRTLMTVFTATMAVTFFVEFGLHFARLFGFGDFTVLLTALISTEVPLWFCQVLLWDRGERTFGAWENRLMRAVDNLERLGVLVEFFDPAITALKQTSDRLTPSEKFAVQAVQFGSAKAYMQGLIRTVRTADAEAVSNVIDQYAEARRVWGESASEERTS